MSTMGKLQIMLLLLIACFFRLFGIGRERIYGEEFDIYQNRGRSGNIGNGQ